MDTFSPRLPFVTGGPQARRRPGEARGGAAYKEGRARAHGPRGDTLVRRGALPGGDERAYGIALEAPTLRLCFSIRYSQ